MTKAAMKRAEKARTADAEYNKLEADFFEWWAQLPAEEEVESAIVGTYLRAAYGAGYITALSEPR